MLPLSAVREWTNPYYSFSLLRLTDSETHTYYHTHTHRRHTHRSRFACWWCRALPIFFFIIIFFFISLISSEVLIVSSWVSVSFPSPLQMSLVLVKVTRAIGLMGCFEKKGEPGWLGFLFVMCWIFSGGSVSMLSSLLKNYQYNVNKNHPYNKYKWNYPTVWHLTVLEYLRVTSHGVYSKEEGWFLHEPLFIFSQINKTMPLSKGQDNSIYICHKFLKN